VGLLDDTVSEEEYGTESEDVSKSQASAREEG